MKLQPQPIASRIVRLGRFRHRVELMEPGGLWVDMGSHWTRWAANQDLRHWLAA